MQTKEHKTKEEMELMALRALWNLGGGLPGKDNDYSHDNLNQYCDVLAIRNKAEYIFRNNFDLSNSNIEFYMDKLAREGTIDKMRLSTHIHTHDIDPKIRSKLRNAKIVNPTITNFLDGYKPRLEVIEEKYGDKMPKVNYF